MWKQVQQVGAPGEPAAYESETAYRKPIIGPDSRSVCDPPPSCQRESLTNNGLSLMTAWRSPGQKCPRVPQERLAGAPNPETREKPQTIPVLRAYCGANSEPRGAPWASAVETESISLKMILPAVIKFQQPHVSLCLW